ncbi:hypothetical protein SAMN05660206_107133 [Sphingobacterium wenxiniae]|uniref:Uncharacterized protein n=1 Tax=Sphingobacterium wenxiniae TaxID=683125 RepID=A0A1I6TY74_9SPHI|nr:hypothetical protein SAMN05660206_107133 [Sphingobacterium wenxiniae]
MKTRMTTQGINTVGCKMNSFIVKYGLYSAYNSHELKLFILNEAIQLSFPHFLTFSQYSIRNEKFNFISL